MKGSSTTCHDLLLQPIKGFYYQCRYFDISANNCFCQSQTTQTDFLKKLSQNIADYLFKYQLVVVFVAFQTHIANSKVGECPLVDKL